MQAIDDQKARAIAEAIERENPGWIVVFGVYSRQFVCFPRFHVPHGTVLISWSPWDVPRRMREIENLCAHR